MRAKKLFPIVSLLAITGLAAFIRSTRVGASPVANIANEGSEAFGVSLDTVTLKRSTSGVEEPSIDSRSCCKCGSFGIPALICMAKCCSPAKEESRVLEEPDTAVDVHAIRAFGELEGRAFENQCCFCGLFSCDIACCNTDLETRVKRMVHALAILAAGPTIITYVGQRNATVIARSQQPELDRCCLCGTFICDESCCNADEDKAKELVHGWVTRAFLQGSPRAAFDMEDIVAMSERAGGGNQSYCGPGECDCSPCLGCSILCCINGCTSLREDRTKMQVALPESHEHEGLDYAERDTAPAPAVVPRIQNFCNAGECDCNPCLGCSTICCDGGCDALRGSLAGLKDHKHDTSAAAIVEGQEAALQRKSIDETGMERFLGLEEDAEGADQA